MLEKRLMHFNTFFILLQLNCYYQIMDKQGFRHLKLLTLKIYKNELAKIHFGR